MSTFKFFEHEFEIFFSTVLMVSEFYIFLLFFVENLVNNKDVLNDTTISNFIQATKVYIIYIFFALVN